MGAMPVGCYIANERYKGGCFNEVVVYMRNAIVAGLKTIFSPLKLNEASSVVSFTNISPFDRLNGDHKSS